MTTELTKRRMIEMPLKSGYRYPAYDLDEVYPGETELPLVLGDRAKLSGIPNDPEHCVEAVGYRSCGFAEWALVGEQNVFLLHTPKRGPMVGQRIVLRLQHSLQSKRAVDAFDATHSWEGDNKVVLRAVKPTALYRNQHIKNAKRRAARLEGREKAYVRATGNRTTRLHRSLSNLV